MKDKALLTHEQGLKAIEGMADAMGKMEDRYLGIISEIYKAVENNPDSSLEALERVLERHRIDISAEVVKPKLKVIK